MRFNTKAIHGGLAPEPGTGAITYPIFQTSTFVQEAPGINKGYDYARTNNPSRAALEKTLADLEGGKYGLAFASGLAAINTCMNLLSAGDHVIAGNDLYGGAYRQFTQVYQRYDIHFSFVPTTDLAQVEAVIHPNTKMLWLESPSNPLLRLTDLAAAAALARKHNLITVMDNTFASPYLQRPLEYGIDIVMQSTTKYLGGHSDLIGGGLITDNPQLYETLKFHQNAVGAIPGPMDCFLVMRGVATLGLRMERHCRNAQAVAEYLESHPKVERVHYPGLASHPQSELAKRQMSGPGGMVSFEAKATAEQCVKLTTYTKLFSLAESLGSVKSLVCHPPSMTHKSIPREERLKAGLSDGLIRLSVGLEDAEDLIEDLEQTLNLL